MTDLTYVDNLRLGQARIHQGDVRWYVVNAAGHAISIGYPLRSSASNKLAEIRQQAYAEAEEGEVE